MNAKFCAFDTVRRLLFLFLLTALWSAAAADCGVDPHYADYEASGGRLQIPALEVTDNQGQSLGFVSVELQRVEDSRPGAWFALVDAAPLTTAPAWVHARYNRDTATAELSGYLRGPGGDPLSYHRAQLALDFDTPRLQVTGLDNLPAAAPAAPLYTGNENRFPLVRGGANQFLLPVEVGSQVFHLLVDTGSDALIIFEDRLDTCNRGGGIQRSGERVTKAYAGVTRSGITATAPVRIGAYASPAMRIMLVQSPGSQEDASLTAKGADGIIGLRRSGGLNAGTAAELLDVPLNLLSPQIGSLEFDLPPAGDATLSFGTQPLLEQADNRVVFRAKALKEDASLLRSKKEASFTDMQVPFRVKTSYGEAAGPDLDILLDTGAVSRLVLDTQVAEQLGYNPITGEWAIDENEDIELNLIGVDETLTLQPKFKVWEVSVAPYSTMGVGFEAVLGISRWQEYVVGFDFVPEYAGGPDGTISLLRRLDIDDTAAEPAATGLPGLNSVGNDEYPAADRSGDSIAFQSDRPGGAGGVDVYVWRRGQGVVPLPGLNSAADEQHPYLSDDGFFLVFESDRGGVRDIYLYNLQTLQLMDLPGLNSTAEDSMPTLSGDGRYLAFVSQRSGNGDILVYDRNQSTLLELPGVNSDAAESAPAFTADGAFLTYTTVRSGDETPNQDIRLYDIHNRVSIPLSTARLGINTEFDEQRPALNLDSLRLAFHSNRNSPELGLFDRDIFVVDALTQIPLAQNGLNSAFDDTAPRFSGDGRSLVFQSRRPGGMGGADIYLYQFGARMPALEEPASVSRDVVFTPTATGQFTAPVRVNNQNKNLLVATSVNALILFQDSAAGIADSGEAVSVAVGPLNLHGTLASADIRVGSHSTGMRIVLAERAQVEALGIATAGSDGLLGLAHSLPAGASAAPPPPPPPADGSAPPPPSTDTAAVPDVPIRVLQPYINMLELDFHDAASAGLSINRLPATGDRYHSYHSYYSDMPGTQPGKGEPSAETLVPFLAASYADSLFPVARVGAPAVNPRDMDRAGFSSLLQSRIVLDSAVAAQLGYNGASWGNVTRLDLSFLLFGSDALLPVVDKIPVADVLVADLSTRPYRALLGLAFWQRYVLGIDYMIDGSNAVLFMTDGDLPGFANPAGLNHHFVPLHGLNSVADDMYGAVSANGYIAFESNRLGGSGDSDVYVWHNDLGLLDLPGLNSDRADGKPSLSGDGSLLAFESERNGSKDIFVYDLTARGFLDLPGLETTGREEHPVLSADGTLLAYSTNGEIRFYHVDGKQAGRTYAGWLNTDGEERFPSLNGDGSLLAFTGVNRADSMGLSQDVFVYNLKRGGLLDLPRLNTAFHDGTPALSPDGNFLAFFSNRYDPGLEYIGSDIMLLELASGELLSLPGLNSPYEDTEPALSDNAEFIVFHSKRPGGAGGYDLYVYQRDLDDKTRYTVSHAYREDGYVADNNGKRLAGVTVQATDADGNLLGSAVTDAAGAFAIDIRVGAPLPIRYSAAQGNVVVDEVGDDTYIPDFEAGNLKFTQVWVEDTLQSGMPSKIWFDVETETPKYNTFVKIYLVKLPTGSVDDLNVADFTPDYTLTALSIDELGTGNSATVTHTQGQDIVTEVSYLTGDKAHVEHSFIVPPEVADGTYAAVFSIGRFDYHPEDDALQSEDAADRRDNFLAAPASVIVGQPDKPNLRILSAALDSNSFELPKQRPTEDSVPSFAELNLNLEVESMAQDTALPVNLVFALNIDGQPYPLSFAASEGTRPVKHSVKTYPVTCRDETRDGYPAGERCASLFRQEQQGYTYSLYIDAAAYDALAAKTADTAVNLVAQLDPAGTVAEWENNTADNRKVMPVMFLAPRTARQTRIGFGVPDSSDSSDWPDVPDYSTVLHGHSLFGFTGGKNYGNNDFAAGYSFHAKLTYAENEAETYPYAAGFDATGNEAYVKIFGNQIDMLTADAAADVNGDQILCSWLRYDVNILGGYKVYQAYYHVDGINPASCGTDYPPQTIELWSSRDMFGNEKYTVSKSKDYEKTFTVGPIPITVAAGVSGDMGIRGNATLNTTNTMRLVVGPYLELKGYAEGGVGIFGITAGVGIELVFLRVELPFTTMLQVLPSMPLAVLDFEAPLIISTLDGQVYLFAKTWWDKYTFTIVSWDGFQWEYAFIDPVLKVWGLEQDQFVERFRNVNNSNYAITRTTDAIDYDWGSGSPAPGVISPDNFIGNWSGEFEFGAGRYVIEGAANDSMVVQIDKDGDGSLDNLMTVPKPLNLNYRILEVPYADLRDIQVDYTEGTGDAHVSLSWYKVDSFTASYYNGASNGDPVLVRQEDEINHAWSASQPAEGVNADDFSVIWEGKIGIYTDRYVFTIISDDPDVGLYIDGGQVTLNAVAGTADRYQYYFPGQHGLHNIKLEYHHAGGDAIMKLDSGPADKWMRTAAFRAPGEDWEWQDMQARVLNQDIDLYLSRYTSNQIAMVSPANDALSSWWRYTGMFNFPAAGTYDFIAFVDDGMKLYVDGQEYLGHWGVENATAYLVSVPLSAGYHKLEVETFCEIASPGNAYCMAQLDWSLRQNNAFTGFYYTAVDEMQAGSLWSGDNYDGTEPRFISKGTDSVSGCTSTVNSLSCDWGNSSPLAELYIEGEEASLDGVPGDVIPYTDPTLLTTDGFGIRWIGDFDFDQGVYLFSTSADDGVRVWVDDIIVIDEWNTVADTRTYQEAVAMNAGTHNIRVEYKEDAGNANVAINWAPIALNTFNAQYFSSADLSGTPTDGGTTSAINYSGSGSARWAGVFEFEETEYTFDVTTDGSVQLYLDGKAIPDTSGNGSVTVPVEEGLHTLKVEYAGGTAVQAAWSGKSEIAGNALSLDGVDDYVSLPTIFNPATAGTFTVETWFRPDTLAVLPQILVQQTDGSGTGRTWLGIGEADELYTFLGGSGLSGTTTLQAGEWHHAAVVYDGIVLRLYLDGELENSATITPESSDGNLLLGIHKGLGFGKFAGTLDEVRIWNTVRSQAQIQAWMKSTLTGTEDNLLAYYPFDQDTTTVTDAAGAYDGTFNGAPLQVTSDALLTELPPPGGALSFDGAGDDVYIANPGDLDLSQGTIEFWMQPQWTAGAPAYNPAVIAGRDTGGTNFSIHIKRDLSGVDLWNGSTVQTLSYPGYFVSGTWYHVALVAGSDSHEVFVNGVSIGTRAYGFSGRTGKPLHIGSSTGSGEFFIGEIDEVRIWNTLRSQSEIQAYMNRTMEGNESGLLAYYNFDQVPGSTAATLSDQVGNHHGTLNGNPGWVGSGAGLSKMIEPGNALRLKGTGDYVELPAGVWFNGDYTIETWVKPNSYAYWSRVLDIGNGPGADNVVLALSRQGSGMPGFGVRLGEQDTSLNPNVTLPLDTWSHLAVSQSGTTAVMYIDGVEVARNTNMIIPANLVRAKAYIGRSNWSQDADANAVFDELRIWNIARSQAEIQAAMYSTVSPFTTGLLAYYRFDQDRGTELIDLTANNYDGTLHGAPSWIASRSMIERLPSASGVTFSGSLLRGADLTGSYVYKDTNGDPESGSTYRWRSASDASGSGAADITAAVSDSHIATEGEVGSYLQFCVTPANAFGIGSEVCSAWRGPIEQPLSASGVIISGDLQKSANLTGSYVYNDVNGDPESGSTYRWLSASDASGSGATEITSAISDSYTVVVGDVGSYLQFCVTPVNVSGAGSEACGTWRGPVIENPPVASEVAISGAPRENTTLTATYSYSDANGDAESGSTYRWRAAPNNQNYNTTDIAGATMLSYTPDADVINWYLQFCVTPANAFGTGSEACSDWLGPVAADTDAPTATGVAVSGTLIDGGLLSATYTYADINGDPEQNSRFHWNSASDAGGSAGTAGINSAYTPFYIPDESIVGKYVQFCVIPSDGLSTGSEACSAWLGPVAERIELPMTVLGYPYSSGATAGALTSLAFSSDGSSGYAVTADSQLYAVDLVTGAGTKIADLLDALSAPIQINDLAVQPGTGVLFGYTQNNLLVKIDTVSGDVTAVSSVPVGVILFDGAGGLAFAPDGTLYFLSNGSLFTLDPTDASQLSTVFVSQAFSEFTGLGISADGTLYTADSSNPGTLYTIDPVSGEATYFGDAPCIITPCALRDIDFHPATGVMYGVTGGSLSSAGALVKFPGNTAPNVVLVGIPPSPLVGSPVPGLFEIYSTGTESSNTYRWRNASDVSGTGAADIGGATDAQYTPDSGVVNKYLQFCVTPSNEFGTGSEACSPWVGPVL